MHQICLILRRLSDHIFLCGFRGVEVGIGEKLYFKDMLVGCSSVVMMCF